MRRRPSTAAFDKRCTATCLAISSVNRGEENWVINPKIARYQDKTDRLGQPMSPVCLDSQKSHRKK